MKTRDKVPYDNEQAIVEALMQRIKRWIQSRFICNNHNTAKSNRCSLKANKLHMKESTKHVHVQVSWFMIITEKCKMF